MCAGVCTCVLLHTRVSVCARTGGALRWLVFVHTRERGCACARTRVCHACACAGHARVEPPSPSLLHGTAGTTLTPAPAEVWLLPWGWRGSLRACPAASRGRAWRSHDSLQFLSTGGSFNLETCCPGLGMFWSCFAGGFLCARWVASRRAACDAHASGSWLGGPPDQAAGRRDGAGWVECPERAGFTLRWGWAAVVLARGRREGPLCLPLCMPGRAEVSNVLSPGCGPSDRRGRRSAGGSVEPSAGRGLANDARKCPLCAVRRAFLPLILCVLGTGCSVQVGIGRGCAAFWLMGLNPFLFA